MENYSARNIRRRVFFPKKQQVLEKRILTKVAFRPARACFKNAVEDLKNGKLGFGFNILHRAWN